jgi:anti-anti-sigma factor
LRRGGVDLAFAGRRERPAEQRVSSVTPGGGRLLEVGAPERSGEQVSIPVRGSLTRSEASMLRDGLIEHYLDDGVSTILLDASDLVFLDEDGVGALLRLRSEAIVKGKRIWLSNARGQVRDKLQLINVLRVFEPPDDLDADEPSAP